MSQTTHSDFSRVNILLAQALETALNRAIHLDLEEGAALKAMPTSVIALQIDPLKAPFYCLLNASQISVQTHLNGAADATIQGGVSDCLGLAKENPNLSHFQLSGDTDLAERFLKSLASIEIDWEEHLASLTGDLIAFKIGHGVRSYFSLKRRQRDYVEQTIKEYLQFEIEAVPTKSQVQHFNQDVEQLSQQLEQIEARIKKLLSLEK